MALMHVGAVVALWHFSWGGLALIIGLHFVTACFGITLGYHRLLTHGSLVVARPVKYFFTLCGMLSAEGSPLMWVATHRKHHVHSDEDEDPHTPRHGFWWSHMLWFYPETTKAELINLYKRWAPDLYKDPVQRFFDRTFAVYPLILGAVLYATGEYFFGQGLSWMLWGLCARMVMAYHSTWFVNSATHIWGYRNYETTDNSRNLWWVALLTYGEGWHNNHHAHQRLAVHGHRWWEFDVTYMVIRLLKATGLATKVHDTVPAQHDA
ncbi:MAG: acyl-CoA desaturase [Planctomycetaceae bacterium]|nr:acyl-CoA desaturase [Planctomycetaceae bacterium]